MNLFKKGPRKLTALELSDLQKLFTLIQGEKFKLTQMESNTALFIKGQDLTNNQKKLIELMEQAQSIHISRLLNQLGYPPETNVNLNMMTGEMKIVNQPNA